ncbi:unnamed protein product [Mesocestoides corti]|uniref:RAVE complex protein Rav1 C-terminal domain-containing protein n=1 Tax=Mesocestoides corti TaxID=53468 RepID=A0A158QVM4_MESCO|nr:unnamed protein product [Mesocestoides corti]
MPPIGGEIEIVACLCAIYGSGKSVVFLDESLLQIQSITATFGASGKEIVSLACEDFGGLIAVSDGETVAVFEPTEVGDTGKARWRETRRLSPRGKVTALAWFPLTSGGKEPTLLIGFSSPSASKSSCYYLSAWNLTGPLRMATSSSSSSWHCAWTEVSPGEIERLSVSPDGRFIACQSAQLLGRTKTDPPSGHRSRRTLHVWREMPHFHQPSEPSDGKPKQSSPQRPEWVPFLLNHPDNVVSFSWRPTSRYLPPGWIPNALLTSCYDGVARIWFECSLWVEGINDPRRASTSGTSRQFSPCDCTSSDASLVPAFAHHPVLQYYLKLRLLLPLDTVASDTISELGHLFHLNNQPQASSFVLVSSINAADTNLSFFSADCDASSLRGEYILQWMNNKAIEFDQKFDRFLRRLISDMASCPTDKMDTAHAVDKLKQQIGVLDHMVLRTVNNLDRSASNGSMLCQHVFALVGGTLNSVTDTVPPEGTQYRHICQTTVSLRSRLPNVVLPHEASAIAHNPLLFINFSEHESSLLSPAYLMMADLIIARLDLHRDVNKSYLQRIHSIHSICSQSLESRNLSTLHLYSSANADGRAIKRLSAFRDSTKFSGVLNVMAMAPGVISQANGHGLPVDLMICHPMLPVVLTLSASELILWQIPPRPPGPLSTPSSTTLRLFGSHRAGVGVALPPYRTAAFFPCLLSPYLKTSDSATAVQPLSVFVSETANALEFFCITTTGQVVEIGKFETRVEDVCSPFLCVVPAVPPMVSTSEVASSYLVIRITSGPCGGQMSLCRAETWRVDLNPCFVVNATLSAVDVPVENIPSSSDPHFRYKIIIASKKVSDQELPLEMGVHVTSVGWAPPSYTGNSLRHPPYLITTTCSDGGTRFWTVATGSNTNHQISAVESLQWVEWELPISELHASRIYIPSQLLSEELAVEESCESSSNPSDPSQPQSMKNSHSYAQAFAAASASNYRVAISCARHAMDPIMVAIFECQSTGGSEWTLEDIVAPSEETRPSSVAPSKMPDLQLDWINTEDGGCMLSVFCDQTLAIFAIVCSEVCSPAKPHVQTCSTRTSLGEVGLRWACIQRVKFAFADSSLSQAHRILWLPGGLLVVNHGSEIHLFSQWPSQKRPGTELETDVANGAFDKVESLEAKKVDLPQLFWRHLQLNSEIRSLSFPDPHDAADTRYFSNSSRLKPKLSHVVPHLSLSECRAGQPFDHPMFTNYGLFEAAQLSNPLLPQFHPRQLFEWLNFGRLRRVQALLVHLTRCLSAVDVACGGGGEEAMLENDVPLPTVHTATSARPPDLEIPPLPLYVLLTLDSLSSHRATTKSPFGGMDHVDTSVTSYNGLDFTDDGPFSSLDDELAASLSGAEDVPVSDVDATAGATGALSQPDHWRASLEALGYLHNGHPSNPLWDPNNLDDLYSLLKFGTEEAQILSDLLSRYHLPGLSRLDQMYLLGIAELMANTRAEITDRLSGISAAVHQVLPDRHGGNGFSSNGISDLELDECGLRFLMTMRLFSYLCGTLPPGKRNQLLKSGLTSRSFVWAFHSEADEVLLNFLPSRKHQRQHPAIDSSGNNSGLSWSEFKRYGCGWWLRSEAALMQCLETVARSEFLRTKDPMESAIFYLAMRKHTVLASLFKSTGNRMLENFFRSDFSPGSAACRQAKLNAFRLLSQHKYHQAAALFLAGGWLEDAIKVCVDSIKDLQLAVVIARLHSLYPGVSAFCEGTASPYHKFLRAHVICHQDPYLRSIAYWVLMEPLNALKTLLQEPSLRADEMSSVRCRHPSGGLYSIVDEVDFEVYPSVFKLYTYLRSHPLVLRQLRLTDESKAVRNQLNESDRRLYFRTAYHYNAIGCPALSLEVLNRLPLCSPTNTVLSKKVDETSSESVLSTKDTNTLFGLIKRVEAPPRETNFTISYDDIGDNVKCTFDEIAPSVSPSESNVLNAPLCHQGKNSTNLGDVLARLDLIHLDIKVLVCLRLFSNELCGFSTSLSTEGSRMRQHIWIWLENVVAIITDITNILNNDSSFKHVPWLTKSPPRFTSEEQPTFLPLDDHGVVEDGEVVVSPCGQVEDLHVFNSHRRKWIKSNLSILQSLINFCNLHGDTDVNLCIVRLELVHLIMETLSGPTQCSPSPHNCLSRLVKSVPLFRAVYSLPPDNVTRLLPHPFYIIKSLIDDINALLADIPPPYSNVQPVVALGRSRCPSRCDGDLFRRISILRNLCLSLSAWALQCLSPGGWRLGHRSSSGVAVPASLITSGSRISDLVCAKSDDCQAVNRQHCLLGVLAEALLAVYMGLGLCALYSRDCSALYRLASSARLGDAAIWARVFGGGYRAKPIRPPAPLSRSSSPPATSSTHAPLLASNTTAFFISDESECQSFVSHFSCCNGEIVPSRQDISSSTWPNGPMDGIADMELKGTGVGSQRRTGCPKSTSSAPRRDEWFLPPQCSIVKCLLEKPKKSEENPSDAASIYDTDDSNYGSYVDSPKCRRRRHRRHRRAPKHLLAAAEESLEITEGSDGTVHQSSSGFPDSFHFNATVSSSSSSSESDGSDEDDHHNRQWSRGDSYAWRLMRLAFVRLMGQQVKELINLLNLDNDQLTTYAPSLLQYAGVLNQWLAGYEKMMTVGVEADAKEELRSFIPGVDLCSPQHPSDDAPGGVVSRMALLLNHNASPFQTRDPCSLPVKRLWFCLLGQPTLSETFVHWIYRLPSHRSQSQKTTKWEDSNQPPTSSFSPITDKKDLCESSPTFRGNSKETAAPAVDAGDAQDPPLPTLHEFHSQLLHREAEPAACICIDKVHGKYVAVALPKQLIEISLSNFSAADWLSDDVAHERALHSKSCPSLLYKSASDYVERMRESSEAETREIFPKPGSHVALKRSVCGVQKLSAHPLLPFYLCGTASGSVHVLEWTSAEPVVSTLTNTFALTFQGLAAPLPIGVRGNPVSTLHMDSSGKRFGCGDNAGNFGLWNLDISGSNQHPYFNCRCHGRGILDFTFVRGTSTLFATVGIGGTPLFVTGNATGAAFSLSTAGRSRHGTLLSAIAPSDLEAANLALWDALMPPKRAAVLSFSEAPLDSACTCVASVPSGSSDCLLVVGTRRGELIVVDVRRQPGVVFVNQNPHDGLALRSVYCDKSTNTLTTTGADGLVKVWRLSEPSSLLATFQPDCVSTHGYRAAAAASIAAAALFRGNQSAAVAAAARSGIAHILPLPSTLSATDNDTGLPIHGSRFLACGFDGCIQLCSVTLRPEPVWPQN